MSASGLSPTRLERVTDLLDAAVDRSEIAGAVGLISRRGEAHVSTVGYQDIAAGTSMRPDTLFRIMSMTKPVLAVAALILVEEGRLRLDAPLDRWLPELADRKVLRSIYSDMDDVIPAHRPITLRDLLTLRLGIGAVMAPPGSYPIQQAMAELELAPGPEPVPWSPDEFLKRLGRLPLIHQPGERWMYHTAFDVLAVLIARVTDRELEEFLTERIFAPLGMKDTGFSVPAAKLDRFATCYRRASGAAGLDVYDPARGGLWATPPVFPSALVSTAEDYLAFAQMLLGLGRSGRTRILARPTVELMTTDHIAPEQKTASPFFPGFWDGNGWGFGVAVVTRRTGIAATPGRYGWDGGFGTTWRSDPREEMVSLLLIQRVMTAPHDSVLNEDFLTLAYQAIDD
jgi:CubicO group peptidase (beta-lactamase class C family)